MPTIPGFWLGGPHDPVAVEPLIDEFVRGVGGERVADLLGYIPQFENADYYFASSSVVAELKEIRTEFDRTPQWRERFDRLTRRLIAEDPHWRLALLGGSGSFPRWFFEELYRTFRTPLSGILKKANRQIRRTKEHFGVSSNTGLLFLVNDAFTWLPSDAIRRLVSKLLAHNYSSIDCFVYMTVNRYVELPGSDVPRIVWAPIYSERADESLSEFVNQIGRKWCALLQERFALTNSTIESSDLNALRGAKSIVIPQR
jgi:hypothetical protein